MRTTLDIDEDVLLAAKEVARDRGTTAGKIISEYARKGMRPAPSKFKKRDGFPQWPARPGAGRATLELVNRLRDEMP